MDSTEMKTQISPEMHPQTSEDCLNLEVVEADTEPFSHISSIFIGSSEEAHISPLSNQITSGIHDTTCDKSHCSNNELGSFSDVMGLCSEVSMTPDLYLGSQERSNSQPVSKSRPRRTSSRAMLSGIGLHLNSLAGPFPHSNTITNTEVALDMKETASMNHCSSLLVVNPGNNFSSISHGKFQLEERRLVGSAENGVAKSACFQSVPIGIDPLDGCKSFGLGKKSNPTKRKINLDVSTDPGRSPQSPKKKRRKTTLGGDILDKGCKRCSCKKSKCLKLYCECFSAGVYCVDPCSCYNCFNKPNFEDMVVETRQQIESRNPLAFAPKIVQDSEAPQIKRDTVGEKQASARHKRGCNCKKSMCLKKYCECYQAGVGCSEGCRCQGCKNVHGTKEDSEELDDKGTQVGLEEKQLPEARQPGLENELKVLEYTHAENFPRSSILKTRYNDSSLLDSSSSQVVDKGMLASSQADLGIRTRLSRIGSGLIDLSSLTPLRKVPAKREILASSSDEEDLKPNGGPLSSFKSPITRCFSLSRHCPARTPPFRTPTTPHTPNTPNTPNLSFSGTHSLDLEAASSDDEIPDFLTEIEADCSPLRVMNTGSPKRKRISPPYPESSTNLGNKTSKPPLGVRTRKFILHSLASFPP